MPRCGWSMRGKARAILPWSSCGNRLCILNWTSWPDRANLSPQCMIGIEPCSKIQSALASVIAAFGTDDREADYTYDGIVNADDIEAVLETFGPSSE